MEQFATPKINVGLNVLRKRSDGFHDIETLFYPVHSMWDTICIEESSSFAMEIDSAGWDPMSDLCVKAYGALKQRFPDLPPVRINLQKGIPVGAGLGGGSSDAAMTLMMLNGMFRLGLGVSTLADLAAGLGSDCAFFIYDSPMYATGRGEVLEPFALDLDDWEIEVETPSGVHVSTAEAYSGVPLCGESRLREYLTRPIEEWRGLVTNDFEKSVFPAHPEIARLKDRMYADGAVYASMTGSGSSVFGLYKGR